MRTLGSLPELVQQTPPHVVVWGRDAVELSGDLACSFTVIVTPPSLRLHDAAILKARTVCLQQLEHALSGLCWLAQACEGSARCSVCLLTACSAVWYKCTLSGAS